MLRIMDYKEVNRRLRLPFGQSSDSWYVSALSPNDRCVWKSIAKEKGAKLVSPFSKSSWKNNRLLVVDPNNRDIPFPYMYIITFKDWDGTIINKIRVAENAIIAPIPDDPERDNYIFDHWETSGGSILNPGVTTATEDATYIALYVSSSYKITWKGNGGTWSGGSTSKTSSANYHDSISSIANASPKGIPTRDEYTFVKWIYNDGSDIGSGDLVEGNVTLKAKWEYTGPTTYTIIFINDDGSEYDRYTNVAPGSTIQKPTLDPSSGQSTPGMEYEFTGWVGTGDNVNKYLGKQIKYANTGKYGIGSIGTYTFIAEYNGKDLPDNHVKILDNIGQYPNSDLEQHPRNRVTPNGYIGRYNPKDTSKGWYSGPMDGHSDDIKGKDAGISPVGSATGRRQLTLNNVVYTAYDGDSIVYEFLTISSNNTYQNGNVARFANNSYKTINDIESSDLISEWTGYDSDGHTIINIKSNSSWIKFAIIAKTGSNGLPPLLLPIRFIDPQEQEPTMTVENVPISVEIVYYVADNNQSNNTASRKGTVSVKVYGEQYNKIDCAYVSSQYTDTPWSDRSYMTEGTVYFYQLGTNLG